jgi:hypothetical protein
MLKTLQTLIDKLASHATLWPLLGGSIMTALAGWATYATELFRAYAPFSWVCAAFLGVLIWVLSYAIWAWARLWTINGAIKQDFYKSSDRINPMDITFTQRRINIYDLVSPIDQSIKGKTFIDCEFIGPANIFIIQSRTGEVFLMALRLL